jgi:hypothetical protein
MMDEAGLACRRCGSRRPAADNFCGTCGTPLGPPGQRLPGDAPAAGPIERPGPPPAQPAAAPEEARELIIPLGLDTADAVWPARFEAILRERLDRAAADGWRPAGPVGWKQLLDSGAIRRQRRRTLRGVREVAESVTVPLRRRGRPTVLDAPP